MITTQAELETLLKLCRKQGVTDITVGGVSIKFGDKPPRTRKGAKDDEDDEIPTDEPTPEQLMFFSAPGGGGNQ